MEELKCIGCGIKIQSNNKDELGFLPQNVIDKKTLDASDLLCRRCFRMKHYNEGISVEMSNKEFIEILNRISKENALIVKIVDLFDFNGSYIDGINRHTGQSDLLLVANKADLIPKAVNNNKIKKWILRQAKEYGLNPLDVEIISAVKNYNIDLVLDMIEHYRNRRNVYIVGCTNTGKSTFINSLLKSFGGASKDIITTSILPGTTLDMINIELDENSFIVDTPGVINKHQIAHYVEFDTYKKIVPKKEIKPKVYQLNCNQTIFIGGLAYFSFIKGDRQSFIFHFQNDIILHRTKYEKKENIISEHIGGLITPPTKEEFKTYKLVTKEFKFQGDKKMDLVISGLGFITIKGACTIEITSIDGVGIFKREALI